jgi:hypothetical protein
MVPVNDLSIAAQASHNQCCTYSTHTQVMTHAHLNARVVGDRPNKHRPQSCVLQGNDWQTLTSCSSLVGAHSVALKDNAPRPLTKFSQRMAESCQLWRPLSNPGPVRSQGGHVTAKDMIRLPLGFISLGRCTQICPHPGACETAKGNTATIVLACALAGLSGQHAATGRTDTAAATAVQPDTVYSVNSNWQDNVQQMFSAAATV